MRLCQRGRAGFRLTDKGRIVYEACQHLATALESFRTTVGALRGELVGDLAIAVIDNWATKRGYPLADVLRDFRSKARQVHIYFHTLAPDEIERGRSGEQGQPGDWRLPPAPSGPVLRGALRRSGRALLR